MAEIIGPCSTLPGHEHSLPKGAKCDLHPRRNAVARIQGETDSMGAELNDMCQACLDEHRALMKSADTSGKCEWCSEQVPKLFDRRDTDEGLYGRVYRVCRPCIDKHNKRIDEELAYMYEHHPLDDYDE